MAVLFTAPFVPMLFQGEEWGSTTPFLYFTDHVEPELARAVSEGRKKDFAAFGWTDIPDPQDLATFERSKVDWGEREREPHADLLAWTRDLIELRRTATELRDGDLERVQVHYDEEQRWMVIERGELRVAFSIAEETQRMPLPGSFERTLLLASHPQVELVHDAIELPPDSVAIIRQPGTREGC
jgi:maltooligosyltrehalose trehalohydrolase